jgi:hypothetical protein
MLGDRVLTAPVVRDTIDGGKIEISLHTQAEADKVELELKKLVR